MLRVTSNSIAALLSVGRRVVRKMEGPAEGAVPELGIGTKLPGRGTALPPAFASLTPAEIPRTRERISGASVRRSLTSSTSKVGGRFDEFAASDWRYISVTMGITLSAEGARRPGIIGATRTRL
jgi:hypothetical protein